MAKLIQIARIPYRKRLFRAAIWLLVWEYMKAVSHCLVGLAAALFAVFYCLFCVSLWDICHYFLPIFATIFCQYFPLKFANIFHIDNYHYSIFFYYSTYIYILLILIFWILLLFYSARIFSFLFLARNFFCTQKSRDFLCRDFLLLYSMTSFSSSLNVNTLYLSFT